MGLLKLHKGYQTGWMVRALVFGLRSPLLLAGVAVALAGLPLPAKARETVAQPATATDGLAQASLVEITDVQLAETETGLQIVLETTGELPAPITSTSGDALILEIPNAVLVGEAFEQFGPAEGIAVVQVSAMAGDRVQITITGADAVPTADVTTDAMGLTFSVAAYLHGFGRMTSTSAPPH